METFSALLALCAGNSPVPCEFPAQRPVMRRFGVFFDLRPNKRLSKQSWGWWFETLSCSLWRHCNDIQIIEFSAVTHRAMVLHNLSLYSFQFCSITFQTIIHAFYIRSLRQSTSSAIGIEYSCRGYRFLLINTSFVALISLPSITLHLILFTLRKTFLNLSPCLQTIVARI